ncbi:hypothetical protein [Pseudoduganella violaceinigra]|uniref:hypothetical protein n=1 Tax=Pseudoduganella violaceinigra TaxID=246602 RepID=UPI0003FC14CC|nr:hypothetical protein [Pseudoduganella violaceinigra]
MKRTLIATLLAFACATGQAADGSQALSKGVSDLSAVVVVGSVLTVSAASWLVVESVEAVGDGVVVVVKAVGDGSKATIQLSGKALEGVSVVAGTSIKVVAMSAGHALVASGKVIAFLPNELGKALLHHSSVN